MKDIVLLKINIIFAKLKKLKVGKNYIFINLKYFYLIKIL